MHHWGSCTCTKTVSFTELVAETCLVNIEGDKDSVISIYCDNTLSTLLYRTKTAFQAVGSELLRIALGGIGSFSTFVMVNWGILFIAIYFFTFKAFVHKDLFEKGHEPAVDEKPDSDQSTTENELEKVHNLLEMYMREYQPYLKSDLTLHELASSIGIPSRKISQCINRRSNVNFSAWINKYRFAQWCETREGFPGRR